MGPWLSDNQSICGKVFPAQIFLGIYQGQPEWHAPPAGQALPESVIWELVAYVQSITEPRGKTFWKDYLTSPGGARQGADPAENVQTVNPWNFTESFPNGQKPSRRRSTRCVSPSPSSSLSPMLPQAPRELPMNYFVSHGAMAASSSRC